MSPANASSPVKRPVLVQRSVSSNTSSMLRISPTNVMETWDNQPQKAAGPKPPRPHVVHRGHVRNLSLGKNLNKLQKAATAQNLFAEATTIGPSSNSRHQRKKSAPVVTPVTPGDGHHVRWDGSHPSLGDHKANTSVRKNHSTPALRRNNTSGVLGKKALVTERLHPKSAKGQQAKKKVVGFELADSESEEWEDSTQSPESTRRNSIAPPKDGNAGAALVDPLTFVKRPYPRVSQATATATATATSLPVPDPTSDPPSRDHSGHPPSPTSEEEEQQPIRTSDHEDITTRLLSQSRPSRAPPAMSPISAMASPPVVDLAHQTASLTTLASSHDPPPSSTSTSALPMTPGVNPQATSSSIEGGVSRFIMSDKTGFRATSRIDSDPNTPSSFLPHYRPENLSSPSQSNSAKKIRATSPPRRVEPPSRTQQKLWLQRTAALTTSPPDPHGGPDGLPASTMDPTFMAASHTRSGMRPYEGGRGAMNGSVRIGGAAHELGVKHIRKLYDKTAAELNVVQRFQSPTKSSFDRVNLLLKQLEGPATGTEAGATKARAKNVKSGPSFHTQFFRPSSAKKQSAVPQSHDAALAGSINKNTHQGSKDSTSHVYFQDHDDVVNIGDPSEQVDRLGIDHQSPHSQRASHPILSPSTDAPQDRGATDLERNSTVFLDENELLLRRVWDSRELASSH